MEPQSATSSTPSFIPLRQIWLPVTVWVVLLLVMNMVWGTPLASGYLADADDYLRMSRVFDLLDGKHYPSWLQPRLGPGGSVENGWSRLLDYPLVAILWFFQLFTPRATAALWTVTVFPALALLVLVFAAVWYVRAAVPEKNMGSSVAALAAVCIMWDLLHQFMPGRVTHHDWQIVLTIAAYGALTRLCLAPDDRRWPAIAGILFATGLGIGADIVPWFALGVALVGLHFVVRGEIYARAALRLGQSAMITTAGWFILLVPPPRYFVPQCDTISPTYLSFAAAVFAFWSIVSVLPASWKSTPVSRLAVCAPVALAIAAVLYRLSPGCFHDIYGITDPLVRDAWLHRVAEAQPVLVVARGKPLFAVFMLGPVMLALAASLRAAFVEKEQRLLWTGLVLVLACGTVLTFWQFRILDYVQAIALLPMAWLILAPTRHASAPGGMTRTKRIACEILFFLVGAFFFLYTVGHRTRHDRTPYKPMQETCSIKDAAPALNAMPAPQMIAAYVDEGSEIIYRTQHWALAGDYHRDQEGIGASYRIFTAPDASAARIFVEKYKVGIILVCPPQLAFWASIAPQKDFFAAQLLDGKIPAWLSRVDSPGAIRIYKAKK